MNRDDAILSCVALGSNMGSSEMLLRDAMDRLEDWSVRPLHRSSLWRSEPVDCPPGSPDFFNAVAALWLPGTMRPEMFLDRLQAMETAFGRPKERGRNEARPLDLDILIWGGLVCDTERLRLPHPRAHVRKFVLLPWGEIMPGLTIPGTDRTVREHLKGLESRERVERVG